MVCETQRVMTPTKPKESDRDKTKKIIKKQAKKLGWQLKPKGNWSFIATKPYSQDKIQIDILKGGGVKITVPGKISAANHMSAETFVRNIQSEIGATVDVTRLGAAATHSHGGYTHTHA